MVVDVDDDVAEDAVTVDDTTVDVVETDEATGDAVTVDDTSVDVVEADGATADVVGFMVDPDETARDGIGLLVVAGVGRVGPLVVTVVAGTSVFEAGLVTSGAMTLVDAIDEVAGPAIDGAAEPTTDVVDDRASDGGGDDVA